MIPEELEVNFENNIYKNTTATLRLEEDILILTAQGTHDIQLAKDSFATILGIFIRKEIHKAIIDISALTGEVSSIEKFDYMEFLQKTLRSYFSIGGRPPKMAYVLEEKYLESNKGFTDVLRKEYSLLISSFTSQEEAKQWLNQ